MAKKRKTYSMRTLKRAAQYLIDELKANGMIVMRYDSTTTKSIYLKIDDGALGTIRISDHEGKPHLAYKYNLVAGTKRRIVNVNDRCRYYCPLADIVMLKDKLIYDKQLMINRLGFNGYQARMALSKQKGLNLTAYQASIGKHTFWTRAKYV